MKFFLDLGVKFHESDPNLRMKKRPEEKTVFKNQTFQALLIIGLLILLIWNALNFIVSFNVFLLIPIMVQMIVLMLIISKSKYAKTGIQVWAVIIMIGPTLSILGKTLKILTGDDFGPAIGSLAIQFVVLTFGILVYHYNSTTVTVEYVKDAETE